MLSYCRNVSSRLVKGCFLSSKANVERRLNRHNLPQISCRLLSCQSSIPCRKDRIEDMKNHEFDVLVIGGGAVGCGCALDAASRGLSTALIEANDFGSGSSSKSSKLIDGHCSYLHSMIIDCDVEYFRMMKKMSRERAIMMHIAPHLTRTQPMVMPVYSLLQLPFQWLSCKLYDFFAGYSNLHGSHFLSKQAILEEFPLLCPDGLVGAVVYYDAQHDDARMCLALANTAAKYGACIINYMELQYFGNSDNISRFCCIKDMLTGEQHFVKARSVINATGASTDKVRRKSVSNIGCISKSRNGSYIALPQYFSSSRYGLLSAGKDKCSPPLIMLPFEGHTILGCIDSVSKDSESEGEPSPNPACIQKLLSHTNKHLAADVELCERHISSAWSGIRPQVSCPATCENSCASQAPVRNYLLEIDQWGMITVAGGSWNTYRQMAKTAVNTAIKVSGLVPAIESSCTHELLLDGASEWDERLPLDLVQLYDVPMDVAQHLSDTYGCNAHCVLTEATPAQKRRMLPSLPYIGAEVQYACRHEHACHLVDIIARRLRVAFVDTVAAVHVLPCIIEIMGKMLDWDDDQKQQEILLAREFLCMQMGLGSIVKPKPKSSTKVAVKSLCDDEGKRMKSQAHTRTLTTGKMTIRPVINPLITAGEMSLPVVAVKKLSFSGIAKTTQHWRNLFMC